MSVPRAARPIERRVTASYLIAFAIVLATFALAVHVAFAILLQRDAQSRVDEFSPRRAAPSKRAATNALPTRTRCRSANRTPKAWRGTMRAARSCTQSAPFRPPPRSGRGRARYGQHVCWKPASAKRRARRSRRAPSSRAKTSAANLPRSTSGSRRGSRSRSSPRPSADGSSRDDRLDRVVTSLRTMREFSADAAHELRGPLAAIASNAGASLRGGADLPDVHRRRFQTIAETAASLGRTVEDLLLLARVDAPIEREFFAVDLGERVRAAVADRAAVAAERGIAVRVDAAESGIYGDPARDRSHRRQFARQRAALHARRRTRRHLVRARTRGRDVTRDGHRSRHRTWGTSQDFRSILARRTRAFARRVRGSDSRSFVRSRTATAAPFRCAARPARQ